MAKSQEFFAIFTAKIDKTPAGMLYSPHSEEAAGQVKEGRVKPMREVARFQGTPAEAVLQVLLRRGPMTVKELQEALQLSSTAVRLHLNRLQTAGLVVTAEERRGVGRPVKVYYLTEKARMAMGSHSDTLALTLLEEILRLEGPEKVRLLLRRVSDRLAVTYSQEVRSANVHRRAQELVQALAQRGIVAEVVEDENAIAIREYTCPYHELAQDYRAICEMEQSMMSQVLGLPVELNECMMDGHRGCVFMVAVPSEGDSPSQQTIISEERS